VSGLRVLVCGGRDFADANLLWQRLEYAQELHGKIAVIIHGGATGADSLAAEWANRERIKAICFNANWRKYGKRAGPLRNQRMIDEGKPDLVVALPGGRGTADMVGRAKNAGIGVLT